MLHVTKVVAVAIAIALAAGFAVESLAATKAPADAQKGKATPKGASAKAGAKEADAPADEKPGPDDAPAKGAAKKEPAAEAGPSAADVSHLAEIQAQLLAGDYDGAIKAAKATAAATRDKETKAEAMRIIADAYRKKCDWRQAAVSYVGLRECCEKGSDDYIRADAAADVLKASPKGVYAVGASGTNPPQGGDATQVAEKPRTLDDDEVLAEALARLASFRATRLKPLCMQLRRKRTPQDIASAFSAGAEQARAIFLLGPDVKPDDAREFGRMAGQRLQEVGSPIQAALQAKLAKYAVKFNNPWSLTNIEKKDIGNSSQACKDMAAAEKQYQECLFYVSGSGEWTDADALRASSSERCAAYEQLAEQLQVPAYSVDIW
ncbi:MAG: hypothetical protein IMZ66_09520 [Planctomycetes bacterium]|nr:hypothetical protein [Planctomycetota bacterium]